MWRGFFVGWLRRVEWLDHLRADCLRGAGLAGDGSDAGRVGTWKNRTRSHSRPLGSSKLRQMLLVCGQQIIGQPLSHDRIAHAAVGQQRFDEKRPAAGQRGLDREFHGGDLADEWRGQDRREIRGEQGTQATAGRRRGQLQDSVRR